MQVPVASAAARVMPAFLVPALLVAAPAAPAAASPLADPTAGRAVFTGAASPHPTSLELNPAALSLGQPGWHVYLSGSGTVDQIGIDRRIIAGNTGTEADITDGPKVRSTRGSWGSSLAGFAAFPSGLFSSLAFMLSTEPAEVFSENQDPLRYHTLGGRYRELKLVTGGSLRVSSRLHVGATVGLVLSSGLDLAYARDTALDGATCGGAPCGIENPEAAEVYRIESGAGVRGWDSVFRFFDDDRLILAAGALLQVAPDWWIGLSYRSPQGLGRAQVLTGRVAVTRPPAACMPAAALPCTATGEATVAMDLPQSVHAALRGRITSTADLVVGLRFENLSRVTGYDVRTFGRELAGVPEWQPRPRGLQNVYAAVAGVEQVDAGQRLVLGGRVGVETAAVPSERISPVQVDGLAITADAGAQLRILPALVVQLTYGAAYYPEVDTEPGAYDPRFALQCADLEFDYDRPACEAVRTGYAIPTAAGRYRRLGHAMRVALRYDFP